MKIVNIPVVNESLNPLPAYNKDHFKKYGDFEFSQDSGADVMFNAYDLNPKYWFDLIMSFAVQTEDGHEIIEVGVTNGIYRIDGKQTSLDEVKEIILDAELNSIELAPGGRVLLPTGMHVAIPEGYEIQVRDRSGVALKKGLMITNGVGTIDACYRGDIGVIISNPTNNYVTINPNEMICQFVLTEIIQANFIEVEELDETTRGEGGYGSTNKNNK